MTSGARTHRIVDARVLGRSGVRASERGGVAGFDEEGIPVSIYFGADEPTIIALPLGESESVGRRKQREGARDDSDGEEHCQSGGSACEEELE